MKTLIKNGKIVTASDTYIADILIDGQKIVAIGKEFADADEVIDASGKFVFPGGIDEHTHMAFPFNGTVSAPWETETIAAAVGGTTTIVDFAIQSKGSTLMNGLTTWQNRAAGNSAVDYGFHLAVTDANQGTIEEIQTLVENGVTSFKLFMAYKGEIMVDDTALYKVLKEAKNQGALTLVHAENGDIVYELQRQLVSEGKTEPKYHSLSRPVEVETEATARAIQLAKIAGAPLFVVHVSCEDSMNQIRSAKEQGLPIFGETCPQYLLLDESYLSLPDFEGAKYVLSPPLRPKENQDILWNALQEGYLQTVGSDHCSFNFDGQKTMGKEDFTKIPNGGNGIENRIALLYSYGVVPGKISINRFVDIMSTTPAKMFGLYPQKGTIAVGSDADIIIFDPDQKATISAATQRQGTDYNCYEGMESHGVIETVLLRGKVIVRDCEYAGELGDGEFQKRQPFGLAYELTR
jgi:dihydropyrimidinase